jgi:hypothetical protein
MNYDYAIIDWKNKNGAKPEDKEIISCIDGAFTKTYVNDYISEQKNCLLFNNLLPIKYEHLKKPEQTQLNQLVHTVTSKTLYYLHLIDEFGI